MKTGWLSPEGDFIFCNTYEHIVTAREILQNPYVKNPDGILEDAGWAQITISQLGLKEQRVYWKHFLTEEQKNFLKPYFEDNDLSVDCMTRMRWEMENNEGELK